MCTVWTWWLQLTAIGRGADRERNKNTTVLSKRRKIKIRVCAGGGEMIGREPCGKRQRRRCLPVSHGGGRVHKTTGLPGVAVAAVLLRRRRRHRRRGILCANPIRSSSCAPEGVSTGGRPSVIGKNSSSPTGWNSYRLRSACAGRVIIVGKRSAAISRTYTALPQFSRRPKYYYNNKWNRFLFYFFLVNFEPCLF